MFLCENPEHILYTVYDTRYGVCQMVRNKSNASIFLVFDLFLLILFREYLQRTAFLFTFK